MPTEEKLRCARCLAEIEESGPDSPPARVCAGCARVYPPSLLKAVEDQFDYALKLTTGDVISFVSAEIHGDYVTLHGDGADNGFPERDWRERRRDLPYSCPRGLDVRVDQIVWCVDAPNGS